MTWSIQPQRVKGVSGAEMALVAGGNAERLLAPAANS
jgi:hypothetical protein